MEQLNGRFAVEPGNGGSREGYLADHKVETFLVVHPLENNVSSILQVDLILSIKYNTRCVRRKCWYIFKYNSDKIIN